VGVLTGLVANQKNSAEAQYDVVTGISAGSINSFALSLFRVGDEASAVKAMQETVGHLNASDVYRMWPGGLVQGLFDEAGLMDTTPLRDTLTKFRAQYGDVKNRRVEVGATDLDTGLLDTWNETVGAAALLDAVMASSAIPGLFPAQRVGVHTYADGGVKIGVNVFGAARRCLEMAGNDASKVIVDIVLCKPEPFKPANESKAKTIEILLRTFKIMQWESAAHAVNEAKLAVPGVNFRYEIAPSGPLPNELDFEPAAMAQMMAMGEKDAITAINNNNNNKLGSSSSSKKHWVLV
jgi:predicted patatin/cPLA2 family phospholipase